MNLDQSLPTGYAFKNITPEESKGGFSVVYGLTSDTTDSGELTVEFFFYAEDGEPDYRLFRIFDHVSGFKRRPVFVGDDFHDEAAISALQKIGIDPDTLMIVGEDAMERADKHGHGEQAVDAFEESISFDAKVLSYLGE